MRTRAFLRRLRQVRASLCPALALAVVSGCTRPKEDVRYLVLPSGDSVRVLLVAQRDFSDGSPSALQLVYRPEEAEGDTLVLRQQAKEVWTAFRPTVERQRLTAAVLTADIPGRAAGAGSARVWTGTQYGFVVRRDPGGQWRFDGDTASLLP